MEQQIKDVCTNVDEMKKNNTSEHAEIKQMIRDFIDGADSKYAPRVAWDIVKIALGVIITGAVGLVVYLIQRHIL